MMSSRSVRPRTVGCSFSSPRTTACRSWSASSPRSRLQTWRRGVALSESAKMVTGIMGGFEDSHVDLIAENSLLDFLSTTQAKEDWQEKIYTLPICSELCLIVLLCCFLRFPNIACELLTSDVSIINDKLAADESLLEMLYHFLEQDPPLNPLLASFFSKTIGNLIARKTEQVYFLIKNVNKKPFGFFLFGSRTGQHLCLCLRW